MKTGQSIQLPISRRAFVASAAATFASGPAQAQVLVNDASTLNPTNVHRIVSPRSTEEIRREIQAWKGPVSIRGSGYSMGGQITEEASLHLDMRQYNRVTEFQPGKKIVRVQTGMRWRDLQEIIDPHNLSVKIMQSYANFTIGGALSVNAHGRYVGLGPVVNSVRRIEMVLANGRIVEASRAENLDLFQGAIGGYGGLGVITQVELDLVPNVRMERRIRRIALQDYPSFFRSQILPDKSAILHNADIDLIDFDNVRSVSWHQTEKAVTTAHHLFPTGNANLFSREEARLLADIPHARYLRRSVFDPIDSVMRPVVWRNHEASLDLTSLPPLAEKGRIFALQEYFIPVAHFRTFAPAIAKIIRDSRINLLNISLRHATADLETILAWARSEVFSFVLFYQQRTDPAARDAVQEWTRKLIDAALSAGGSYYLPYQLHATKEQFQLAYPGADRFFALKATVDPRNQFRNKMWDKYGAV